MSTDYAEVAGKRDDTVAAKTGRRWSEWVELLDAAGAAELPHGEIASLVHEKYGVSPWWAQTVTVGYERIRGLRDHGQRRGGSYEASRSRTYPVPVEDLFEAWSGDGRRRQWLRDAHAELRTAASPKSVRLDWPDGTRIEAWFTAKGPSKSSVAVSHVKLPDRAAADRAKAEWSDRLDALGECLAADRSD